MLFYKFNIGDYEAHTKHLEPMEDLAYRRLIDWQYLHEKPLPLDIDQIAREIRLRQFIESVEYVLDRYFERTDEGYINSRVDHEIAVHRAKSEKARQSVMKRWNNERKANVSVLDTNVSSSDTNVIRTHYECNTRQLDNKTTRQERSKTTWEIPDWINLDAWKEFEQHRRESRKPLTDLARAKAANSLKDLSFEEQQACIDKTIQNRWSGLFPENKPKTQQQGMMGI